MRDFRERLDVVKAALRDRYQGKKEGLALLRLQQLDREVRVGSLSVVPRKKDTRLRSAITRGGDGSLNGKALRESPGVPYGRFDFYLRMINAEGTGCREATEGELRRLSRSAQNANTTDRKRLSHEERDVR